MKKFFAILMIVLMATAIVFADSEAHTIKIKADVASQVPAFQLWYGEAKTNTTPTVFTNSASYDEAYDSEAEAVDTGFNLDVGGTVTVYAVLANAAKINAAYTLTFSDGVFAVKRNAISGTLAPTITTTAGSVITGTSAIAKTTAAADAPVQVTFNGTTVTASNPQLATAAYAYTGDPTIDPNATGEFYYADITLTVATV